MPSTLRCKRGGVSPTPMHVSHITRHATRPSGCWHAEGWLGFEDSAANRTPSAPRLRSWLARFQLGCAVPRSVAIGAHVTRELLSRCTLHNRAEGVPASASWLVPTMTCSGVYNSAEVMARAYIIMVDAKMAQSRRVRSARVQSF